MMEKITPLSVPRSRISSAILANTSNMEKRKIPHSESYSEKIATSERKVDLVSPVEEHRNYLHYYLKAEIFLIHH